MMKITGIALKNPTMLASGVMGTTGASLLRIAHSGAGAVVTKSIGLQPANGHSNPCMIKLDCGYLNAMGLPNPAYEEFSDEIKVVRNGTDVPVIGSIFGSNAEEIAEVALGFADSKPDAFELNFSCPHAKGYGAAIGTDSCMVEAITSAVCDAVDIPVWVKLTPNVADITMIGKAAEKGGADAIVAINTVRGMAIDIYSGYPILGNRFGGLSGAAIKPVAVKAVYDLYEALEIPVIGVGGISRWEDAVEMMMAGASAVQIGSAVYDNLNVFLDIDLGISSFLTQQGYSCVEDIIGISHEMI